MRIVIVVFVLIAAAMLVMMSLEGESYHFHKFYVHKHSMKPTLDDMELNKHLLMEHVVNKS